jgi:hypothetical protein
MKRTVCSRIIIVRLIYGHLSSIHGVEIVHGDSRWQVGCTFHKRRVHSLRGEVLPVGIRG